MVGALSFPVSVNVDEERVRAEVTRQQNRGGRARHRPDNAAVVEHVRLAKAALSHYIDFHQKKRLRRQVQVQRDRKQLPIAPYEAEIAGLVQQHQVLVLAGDTGCGKSTQVPQFLLAAGCDKIAVTQPRRLSAVSLTRRVAVETNNEFGSKIAHQIRFDSNRTSRTRCVFMTEGVLLRQAMADPKLSQYDLIILDEVHERHVSTDLLLGLMKGIVLPRAPNIRLILMSATVNLGLFSAYFGTFPSS